MRTIAAFLLLCSTAHAADIAARMLDSVTLPTGVTRDYKISISPTAFVEVTFADGDSLFVNVPANSNPNVAVLSAHLANGIPETVTFDFNGHSSSVLESSMVRGGTFGGLSFIIGQASGNGVDFGGLGHKIDHYRFEISSGFPNDARTQRMHDISIDFVTTTVPEPSTLLLLAIAAVTIVARQVRSRRR